MDICTIHLEVFALLVSINKYNILVLFFVTDDEYREENKSKLLTAYKDANHYLPAF